MATTGGGGAARPIEGRHVSEAETPRAAFISYAAADAGKAEEIVRHLEAAGLSCWVAPRDVTPGAEYGNEIIRGIENSRCLVLVLSAAANASKFVRREVERAVSKGKPVIPFRIESVLPSPQLELFVSSTQWIDAWNGPMVAGLRRLSDALHSGGELPLFVGVPRRPSRRPLLVGGVAAVALVAVVGVWRPWRAEPERQAVAALAAKEDAAASRPATGTWDGTLRCGGRIGLRMALSHDRPDRLSGFMYSYTTTGGRRTRPQCNAVLGTYDSATGEMSVRAQPEGQPQSLANTGGYRGAILSGHLAGDRFAGEVDYIGGCTGFVLMRTEPTPATIPACARTLPPNPDVGRPDAELAQVARTAAARIDDLYARWKRAAAASGHVNACTEASIEGWAAQAYMQWHGEWVSAHPLPKDKPGKVIWTMNFGAALHGLDSYPVDAWNGVRCKAAMERRVLAMAHELADQFVTATNAQRVLARLP